MKTMICLGLLLATQAPVNAFPGFGKKKTDADKLSEIASSIEKRAANAVMAARTSGIAFKKLQSMELLLSSLSDQLKMHKITDKSEEAKLIDFAQSLQNTTLIQLGQILTLGSTKKQSRVEIRKLNAKIDKFINNLPQENYRRLHNRLTYEGLI